MEHISCGTLEHEQQRDRDRESSDGICDLKTSSNPQSTDHNRERSESVASRVETVGDERGRPDAATGPYAIERHELVAGEAGQTCCDDERKILEVARLDQSLDGFIRGEQCRGCDGQHDGQPAMSSDLP